MAKATVLPRGIARRNGVYAITVRYRGHIATATEPTLYFAEIRKGQLLEALIAEQPVGVPPPKPGVRPWTLENTYDRTSEVIWRHKPGGMSAMCAARSAIGHFGKHTLVSSITPHMIDHWVECLRAKKLANGTINRHLSALSRMIRFAYSRGGTDQLPVISRLKERPGRVRYLSIVEEAKMFNYLEARPAREGAPFIRLLLDTGMRVSEMLQMTEGDVDFERGLIHLWRTKGNKPRAVPMTTRVRKILRDRTKGERLRKYFPYCYRYYHNTWKQVRHALGLDNDPEFVIHCLRHTCASRLIHHGVHVLTVKEWLGHKSIAATLRYIHLAPKNLFDAAQVLETGRMAGPRVVTWDGDSGGWRSSRREG